METEKEEELNLPDLKISRKERYKLGKSLRRQCPVKSHGELIKYERDPVKLHQQKTEDRIGSLLPIHFKRMLESPFAYYRGAAAIMASDLSKNKSTSINIQICGDCHLLNFGGFATPERKIIFDINDFDETTTGPWEWDVKRLAASFMIAGKWKNFTNKQSIEAARIVVRSYVKHMKKYAEMSALQVWYEDIDLSSLVTSGKRSKLKMLNAKKVEKAMQKIPHAKEFEKFASEKNGQVKIIDQPPLIYHVSKRKEKEFFSQTGKAFERYLETLDTDRKILLSKYTIKDIAMKVVGVGSVGTWCGVLLLMSDTDDPLFLQLKEAHQSVLTPYSKNNLNKHQGKRVVQGQKLMQSASDIFLGWTTGDTGRHYYIRQLRDAKIKPDLELMDYCRFLEYAKACGWALAQAHARTGDAALITGYVGKGKTLERAVGKFAVAYARQNNKDYKALLKAVKKGIIKVKE